jgi:glioma pathogenesis-related protein 2
LILPRECQESINKAFLASHNEYRAKHGADELILSSEIVETAQNFSANLATNDLFQHSDNEGLGENIALSSSSNGPDLCNCRGLNKKFNQNN